MRRMILLLALLSLCFTHALRAQITDVYAGNDTIELRLGNYQYGFIQWQTSQDTVNWENIEGATDPVYRFLPTENAYYRALAFFDNCPDVTSRVCYVQVPPKADAGPDRKLMEDSGATMFASMGDDCVGRWEIIEGANGMLDDPNSPNAYFEGTDREYKLKWTVTNACGSACDTITIRYYHTVLNENYLVVDTTDVLLSDSTQLVNGRYLIAFSEPVSLNDSMLLCGVGEHGFLRKIVSYTYDSELDVYDIETEQATVSDFLIDGVLSIDLNAMKRRNKVVYSHRYPTRKDIAELGFDYMYFRLPDSSDSTTAWTLGQKGWKVNWRPGPLSLPGYIIIDPSFDIGNPNVIFEIEKDFPKVTYLKVGLQVDYHLALRFGLPSASGVTIYKDKESLLPHPNPFQYPLGALGPVTVDFEFDVLASLNASLTLDTEMTFELSKDGTLTHYIVFDPTAPEEWTKHYGVDTHPMQFEVLTKPMEYADLSVKASLGPQLSFLFGKIVRLYAEVDVVAEEKFCIFGEGFNSGEFRLGLDFVGGLKAKIWKKLLFDLKYSKTLCNFIDYKDPASIHYFSGNQQVFNPDNHLPEPIAVQLRNSRGKPSSGTRVKFETDDGYFSNDKPFTNGNGVAYTNWICGNNPTGIVTARATAFNYKHEPIENAPVHFKAFHGNSSIPDCFNTTLAVTADVSSGYLRPKVTGGQGSYLYSTDGVVFSPTWTPIVPVPGTTYHLYVKDAFDCVAECYYTHPTFDCFSSGLQLIVNLEGNTVTATAQGGKSPYQFCLDNGSYGSTNVFQNLIDGRHVVYVRDDNGCEEAEVITINADGGGNTGGGSGGGGGSTGGSSVTVTTSPTVNVIDATSATGGGSFTIVGDATVVSKGICWSTHHAPTTADEYYVSGSMFNVFNGCLMTNLSYTEVYYVRAFVVTNTGTVYGNEVGFSTTDVAPVVTCGGVGNLTTTTARALGNVSNINGTTVTERGFCWSRSHIPTVSGNHLACGSGTGVYSGSITGLEPDTPYYLRAYATNSVGTAYSDEVSFRTFEGGGGGELPEGAINGKFSINSNGDQVYFSRGNLQYQASTNTWRFAENQLDYIGENNANISQTYNAWIDLFGWGTSGYNHGAVCYQPWSIAQSYSNNYYNAYGAHLNLYDSDGTADWGYNPISNGGNMEHSGWRTLTEEEWVYVFHTRITNSGIRYVKACVNNVNGVILLPDDWDQSIYALNSINPTDHLVYYTENEISITEWEMSFEKNGAVFLPAAGWREVTTVKDLSWGNYWSASCNSYGTGACRVQFGVHGVYLPSEYYGFAGYSVRLVRDQLPQVFTSQVTSFTSTTATFVGEVVSDGGTTVIERGVCWGTSHNPTLNDHYGSAGAGLGTYMVSATGLIPETVYYVRAYATNATGTSYGGEVNFIPVESGYHEYVDLGLPSGILWATCNLGANSPEEYGGSFAYQSDVASTNWSNGWKTPNRDTWEELWSNTTNTWTTQNGVNGMLLTGSNGRSIFLPAAGGYVFGQSYDAGSHGLYWTSTGHTFEPNDGWYLNFYPDGHNFAVTGREYSLSVRPVRQRQP